MKNTPCCRFSEWMACRAPLRVSPPPDFLSAPSACRSLPLAVTRTHTYKWEWQTVRKRENKREAGFYWTVARPGGRLVDKTVEFYTGSDGKGTSRFLLRLGNELALLFSLLCLPVYQIWPGFIPSRPFRHLKLAWDLSSSADKKHMKSMPSFSFPRHEDFPMIVLF